MKQGEVSILEREWAKKLPDLSMGNKGTGYECNEKTSFPIASLFSSSSKKERKVRAAHQLELPGSPKGLRIKII